MKPKALDAVLARRLANTPQAQGSGLPASERVRRAALYARWTREAHAVMLSGWTTACIALAPGALASGRAEGRWCEWWRRAMIDWLERAGVKDEKSLDRARAALGHSNANALRHAGAALGDIARTTTMSRADRLWETTWRGAEPPRTDAALRPCDIAALSALDETAWEHAAVAPWPWLTREALLSGWLGACAPQHWLGHWLERACPNESASTRERTERAVRAWGSRRTPPPRAMIVACAREGLTLDSHARLNAALEGCARLEPDHSVVETARQGGFSNRALGPDEARESAAWVRARARALPSTLREGLWRHATNTLDSAAIAPAHHLATVRIIDDVLAHENLGGAHCGRAASHRGWHAQWRVALTSARALLASMRQPRPATLTEPGVRTLGSSISDEIRSFRAIVVTLGNGAAHMRIIERERRTSSYAMQCAAMRAGAAIDAALARAAPAHQVDEASPLPVG